MSERASFPFPATTPHVSGRLCRNGKTLGHAAGGEKRWADVPLIGAGGWGDAILDRLVHNAHKLELKGDSLRKKGGKT